MYFFNFVWKISILSFLMQIFIFPNFGIKGEIYSKKCLKWRNVLKVSCGYIYDDYAQVNWNIRNQEILKSIDKFCETCNLKNELFMFDLSKEEIYKINYKNNKIIVKNTKTNEIFETVQDFSCFECFLNLYF